MTWVDGVIADCHLEELTIYEDGRGWLAELFRTDELEAGLQPAMCYISQTLPGQSRGPHEHMDQTDLFAFFSGRMSLYLWDTRQDSGTYGYRQVVDVGSSNPLIAFVPPGVVHAYRNDGDVPALIVNCPNRLYAGPHRSQPVDEIRHEEETDTRFKMD